jgi:putative ABC transport system ATP-binding protein
MPIQGKSGVDFVFPLLWFDGSPLKWKERSVTPVLEVRALTKTYKTAESQLTVLKDVSFAVDNSASCAIVGPSGSGKTTLLALCAGLDTPSSGTVLLNGHDLGSMNEDERARLRSENIGFVFQNFQLLPTLTALENVMVPLELRGERHIRDLAISLLKKVGLGDRLTHYPAQLSGGEQQRVALARAFVNKPRILFADEPTGNLDNDTSEKVIDLLFDLNRSSGTALVLVTHNLELATKAGRVIRLKSGHLIEDRIVEAALP